MEKYLKKHISVVTQCFNEELNILELYTRTKDVFKKLSNYSYEHIFIDNCSEDKTVDILKKIVSEDNNVRIIVNTRNFGQVRSANHAILQAQGDAIIHVVADLQDPPEMIPRFLKKWEEGYKVVTAIKAESEEFFLIYSIRKFYYYLLERLSDSTIIKQFTGFGLYDKEVINIIREINDPYPYFRGLISELGFEVAKINYKQPLRKKGVTKQNFYTLYDMAMLGITNHSKVPLRMAVFIGFITSIISILVGLFYLGYKILYWNEFVLGTAPLIIGIYFFGAVQLFFIGIIGEYIGAIYTQTLKRPMVIEKERINF